MSRMEEESAFSFSSMTLEVGNDFVGGSSCRVHGVL